MPTCDRVVRPRTIAALPGLLLCFWGALACSGDDGGGDSQAGSPADAPMSAQSSGAGTGGTPTNTNTNTNMSTGNGPGSAETAGAGGSSSEAGAGGSPGAGGTGGASGSASNRAEAESCVAEGCTWLCEGGLCQCDCPGPLMCVVARDLASCCATYRAVNELEAETFECLVQYPWVVDDDALTARCLARSPVDCAVVQCGLPMPAPSRVAAPDGMGGCTFASECQDGNDCMLAVDKSACCSCPTSTPRSLVIGSTCLTEADDPGQPPLCIPCSSGLPCGPCPDPIPEPTCLVSDELNVCR